MSRNKHKEKLTTKLKAALVSFTGFFKKTTKNPNETLDDLFSDVEKERIYKDSKSFADMIPRFNTGQIKQEYILSKNNPNFDLQDFIGQHFQSVNAGVPVRKSSSKMTPKKRINELWDELERINQKDIGSLISLPYPYIVPGGRFSEQFYWDSYFIMLGLAADDRWDLVEGMFKNFAYLLRRFGYIPTANRTYFLGRSQPPFFSNMVRLLAKHKGKVVLIEHLPSLLEEYKFWMDGHDKLKNELDAYNRVVKMPNGAILNRYFDKNHEPRIESFDKDINIKKRLPTGKADDVFTHLRAGAESGWDFSSRWLDDPNDLSTIQTSNIIPVDLNSLLYQLEELIAEIYTMIRQPALAEKFYKLSQSRAQTLMRYCWDELNGFFVDYDIRTKNTTGKLTLASVFPLYAKIATTDQAALVASCLKKKFLKTGGLVPTLINTKQQWDNPNGWAPLHWIAIEGLRNYEYDDLANSISNRWIRTNLKVFNKKNKFVEKYNVVNPGRLASGGEYPLQDGFGWTNGVLACLLKEDASKRK